MKDFYVGKLKEGWTLSAIDDTDFFYYLDIIAYMEKAEMHNIDELF